VKVKIAKTAGFCMGVERAMNMVLYAVNHGQGRIYTYGPLIHNPQVIQLLEKRDVRVAHDVDDLQDGKVLIRAHGIPPLLREKLKESSADICDATCPRVGNVQSIIKKYIKRDYIPIIVGDAGHPEVIGLMGYSLGRGLVVNSVEDIDGLPQLEKVVVVAQTTQDEIKYGRIVEKIKRRYQEVISLDTICESTRLRQEEVRDMAGEVDSLVVVGGKDSGNTRRLAEISENCGIRTYQVESEEELEPEQFAGDGVVGVSAGASTPDWTIRRVVEKLSLMGEKERGRFNRGLTGLLYTLYCFGIYTSLSASGLMALVLLFGRTEISLLLLSVGALFIFALQALSNLTNREFISFADPGKGEVLNRYRHLLTCSAIAAGSAAAAISASMGMIPLIVCASAAGTGIATFTLRRLGKKAPAGEDCTLRAHRGENEIALSLAWAAALAGIPAALGGLSILFILFTGGFVFLAAFLRLNLVNLHDLQGDKMMGRMTLVAMLGSKKAEALLYKLAILLAALPAVGAALRVIPFSGFAAAVVPVYLLIKWKIFRANAFHPAHHFFIFLDSFMLIYLTPAVLWNIYLT
jgi:4-hydroxy-3-methylbut-2-enyl diphosphate reductase